MKENKIYADLDLAFVPHPMTGDLEPKFNQEALKRSIRHLFYMNPFDIPFQAKTKSNLKKYLFEQNNHITRSNLRDDLLWITKKLEPRIDVKGITVEPTSNGMGFEITVVYAIRSLNQEDSFNFIVERAR